jgi:Zn-dependent protease/predicted transcriptional regulator
MRRSGTRLFDIAGFEIRLDPSWFIIAALLVWTLSRNWFPFVAPGFDGAAYLTMAVIAMLALFACLLVHELAHSVVARRFGLNVGSITLFIFGGVAQLDEDPADAKSEFWIAIAGPIASFVLALLIWLVALSLAGIDALLAPRVVLEYLATLNLVLALFNLVPAFPLDGGRILRAAVWHLTGSVVRATTVATTSGALFAFLLIGWGIYRLVATGDLFGLWPVLIGIFILGAARATQAEMTVRSRLGGYDVAQLMSQPTLTTTPGATLADLVDGVMIARGVSFVPVIDDSDRLVGLIDAATVRGIDRATWHDMRVRDVMKRPGPGNTLSPDTPAAVALRQMTGTGPRKFMVAQRGRLLGIVTLADLMNYVTLLQEIGQSPHDRRYRGGGRGI